jgi:hypothetical protein
VLGLAEVFVVSFAFANTSAKAKNMNTHLPRPETLSEPLRPPDAKAPPRGASFGWLTLLIAIMVATIIAISHKTANTMDMKHINLPRFTVRMIVIAIVDFILTAFGL